MSQEPIIPIITVTDANNNDLGFIGFEVDNRELMAEGDDGHVDLDNSMNSLEVPPLNLDERYPQNVDEKSGEVEVKLDIQENRF